MAIWLVRHAQALGRSSWDGPDVVRPLTPRGERQAKGLVEQIGDAPVRRIWSSPAVRCLDTVAPLAATLGLPVRSVPGLAEGADPKQAYALLLDAAAKKGDSVLCMHGDLIPELLRAMEKHDVKLEDDVRYAKGSTWVIDVEDGKLTQGRYLEPPA